MLKNLKLRCQFIQLGRRLSVIFSSQFLPCLHSSWRIFFPSRTNGDSKPRGSKTALTVDKTPCRVAGRSIISFVKRNVTDSMHHWTPKANRKFFEDQVKIFDATRAFFWWKRLQYVFAVRYDLMREFV